MVRTDVDLILESYTDRMETMRKIMLLHRCGMKEAKGFLEKLPKAIFTEMEMYHAMQLREELEKIGCTIRIE